MIKKILKYSLMTLTAVVLILIIYVLYVLIDYKRLDDNLNLDIYNNQAEIVQVDTNYSITTYNIGFGAYEDDYSFFMDGGKYSRAFSKERLNDNLKNIESFLKKQNSDFYLIQEVDEKGKRNVY